MSNVPLPRPGPLGLIQYAGVDMQEYAAAVSAAKDKEIERLRARVRVLKDARPEPDCRLCRNFRDCSDHGYLAGWCKEGNQYEPLPPVRLWKGNRE